MTISHHPPEDLLAHYAAGALSEAEHLVAAVHVAGCARCQRFVGRMEMLAGAALADAKAPPEPPGAFAAIMAEIDRSPRAEPQSELMARSDPELAELDRLAEQGLARGEQAKELLAKAQEHIKQDCQPECSGMECPITFEPIPRNQNAEFTRASWRGSARLL